VFKRRSSDESAVLEQDQAAGFTSADASAQPASTRLTPKKGAPTPKRSEAEAKRRQPYQAPTDRKSASQQSRQRGKADRIRKSQALQRGEQWALPAKDQGPVRALARDVVDSRRGIGEYYLFTIFLLVVLLVLPWQAAKLAADGFVVLALVIMLGEGRMVAGRVKRLAAERCPGQSTRGLTLYVTMRGISLRRMRIPKPRVSRGDEV
jgi:hypothetical protein